MNDCDKCKCLTCQRIETCTYHELCAGGNGQTQGHVTECRDYTYSEKNDKYFNGDVCKW